MKYLMFNYIKFVAFIYWVKTSFSTLFIKQNNLSSYKDYPPQLTSLPYFVKFYLNEVIRLAGKEGYYLLLRLFCLENKVKIRFSSSCYVNSNLLMRYVNKSKASGDLIQNADLLTILRFRGRQIRSCFELAEVIKKRIEI